MPLTARIIGMTDLVISISEASGKYLSLEGLSEQSVEIGGEKECEQGTRLGWALRDSREPRPRMTINDHGLQKHRRWSGPQPASAIERGINHILLLFRF